MSSISTTKALAETRKFAGRGWYYEFREIGEAFDEAACQRVAERLAERYSRLTKSWTKEANSEWVCRLYLASKLVMGATLHVSAAHFAKERNLRLVVPYLRYYAVLSLTRAICFTLPDINWSDGALIKMTHASAIRQAIEHVSKFDKPVAQSAKSEIRELKAERELLSYRAPSSGDDNVKEKNQFLSLCSLLAEVAQFNSEVLESSVLKNSDRSCFVISESFFEKMAGVEIEGHYFGDCEDAYRMDYLARKQPYPTNLLHLMTEGHVDRFFGAWASHNDDELGFNPDNLQGVIFDVP